VEEKEHIQQEYEAFLQEVLNNREIWFLENDDGMACQNALEHEDRMSILFWSNGMQAENERAEEFEHLEAHSLSLYELIFHWLPNMAEEQVVCGLNWNADDGGLEVEPLDLLKHLKLILPVELQEEYRNRT
jgi:hypothetical protein